MPSCETVSLLQFYKFINLLLKADNDEVKQTIVKWTEIFNILYQIGAELMFLFNDGLSLIIRKLSLISDKNFSFSWAKKLSKEVK